MSVKPKTAAEYFPEQVELTRRACLHIATILGDYMDDLVVVGGLVPSLIIDQLNLPEGAEPHAGTQDLDIGLSLAVFEEERYQNIVERLRGVGFKPDQNDKGNATKQRWQKTTATGKITIDFLIPPLDETEQSQRIKHLDSDFGAIITSGLDLAFNDYLEIPLEGKTLDDEDAKRSVNVCGPGAYIVLKSLAFRNRGENKDAYDLFYLIRNFGSGPDEVCEKFVSLFPHEDCEKAIKIIKEDFQGINSIGVQRAVAFRGVEGQEANEYQAEVTGFFTRFIKHFDSLRTD